MIRSIINFAFRNFRRNFSFSTITIGSLVLGITTALLMLVWVKYEISFDKSIIDGDRIYAVLMNYTIDGEIHTEQGTNAPLMDFLSHDVPEVEAVTRISNSRMMLTNGKKSIQKIGVYGDSSFFKVHQVDHVTGNINQVLIDNRSIVISQKLALELYGTEDVIGKPILLDQKTEHFISGVYAPFPYNSHFSYIHFILPFDSRPKNGDDWLNHDVKLFSSASKESVEKKIDRKLAQLYPHDTENSKSLLFGLKDWRLHWQFKNGKPSGGRITYVIIFSLASLFVLIMSCVNYMNLATARATKRTREIGVRKITGASQSILIRQFMLESLLLTGVALIISVVLAQLLLPFFNQFVGVQLSFSFFDSEVIVGLLCVLSFTSVLAGFYPALVLSSFKPTEVLKGSPLSKVSGGGFRNGLVVFQFALSVVMIFCALVVWKQTDFLLKKDLGYDKYGVINVWFDRYSSMPFENIRAMAASHSSISSASFGGASPMEVNGHSDCNRIASPLPSPLPFYGANIDEHFLNTLKFKLISGRNFSSKYASDSSNFIITQTAARLLGFEHPIGQRISYTMFGKQEGEIIGVINDFQNDDIHIPVKPVVFVFGKPQFYGSLFVRYQDGRHEEALTHLKSVFEKIQPGIPLNYSFLDSDFENQLHRETLLRKISITFTIIAVAIACLGLLGLVLFNVQRRTKEIGVRKVLGATENQIVLMLCRHVLPFVFYSLVIAFPIGYYLMQYFLEDYPTRIAISLNLFLVVGGLITLMVLLTISYQSLKAARQNAVESLKTE